MVDRRVAGEPLEQVVGWAEFCGLRIGVRPGVFVPRHRSELLVTEAAAVTGAGDVVVDMCCGSGAIGAAIAHMLPGIDLHSADLDAVAVACARGNLEGIGSVYCGDLFDALPASLRGRVDVAVANVPYVPTLDIRFLPREARDHEPLHALDGGEDGLNVLRRLAAAAPAWLAPEGHLLVETSDRQAAIATAVMTASGLTAWIATDDELEATVVVGRRDARPSSATNP